LPAPEMCLPSIPVWGARAAHIFTNSSFAETDEMITPFLPHLEFVWWKGTVFLVLLLKNY